MKIEILHKPSYAMANIILDKGEEIQTETNSMVSMSGGVRLETEVRGGILKGLTRMILGGESFFINRFISDNDGEELNLAPSLPGDVEIMEISGTMFLQSGSFLASETGIDIDVKWGGAQSFFSKEGLFLLKISGTGKLVVSSYGAIFKKSLKEGEKYIVDTGHIVGFTEGVRYNVRGVGGLKQTLLSGEGLVVELEGPGDVYIQTRNESDFISWIMPHISKNMRD